MRTQVLVAAAVLIFGARASAQGCMDNVPVDTSIGLAYGNVVLQNRGALPRSYLESLVQRVSAALIDETELIRPSYPVADLEVAAMVGRRSTPDPLLPVWPGYPELVGRVSFTIHRDGTIADATASSPGDPLLAARIVSVLSDVGGGAFPAGTSADQVKATLQMSIQPDTSADASQPLIQIASLRMRESEPARWDTARTRHGPRYPSSEIARENEALVVVWVDVDSTGRPDMRSFGSSATTPRNQNTYDGFVDAVRSWLGSTHFQPPRVGQCAVPARIIFATRFGIGPSMTRVRIYAPPR